MNEKFSFGKKALSIALTAAMATTMTAVSAASSVSAVTKAPVASKAATITAKSGADASAFSWD
ncbi:MAG: hypothetical protein UD936_08510, partial [Acutalibacteraceae bacterium]|nr:hypothetical protein [Acutalibacteraceae bacterium]